MPAYPDPAYPESIAKKPESIAQESVNNVIKHSGAADARVEAKRDSAEVRITVRDNGRGFDGAHIDSTKRGMGVVGLRERAGLLNGKFFIDSKPGEGTTIRVHIPISTTT
jgi:two-component system sensor kinase